MEYNKLTLGWIKRVGGPDQKPSDSVDFLVDGKSLFKLLNAGKYDLVGVFSPIWKNNQQTAKYFKLKEKSPINNSRVLLFGCGECLDIGCGGITMKIEFVNDYFVWSDFAYENDYDDSMTDRTSFASIGPLKFNREEYLKTIDSATVARVD